MGAGQQVLYQCVQAVALPLDGAEELVPSGVVLGELGLPKGLRVADDRGQRGAQLVRGHGDELALQTVQAFQLGDRLGLRSQQALGPLRLLLEFGVLFGERLGYRDDDREQYQVQDAQPDEHGDDDRPEQRVDLGLDARVVLVYLHDGLG